jgi:hypothetical protein
MYGIGLIEALPADPHWLRHYADPFPIANSRGGYTAMRCKFTNCHITRLLDLKSTLSFGVDAMTIATTVCASLFCLAVCAAARDDGSPVIACNLKAISAADRPRYNDLTKRLRGTVRDRNEVPDGYLFKLDSKGITLPEVAAWISLERLCCPFLTFQLSTSGNQADWLLKLTGPTGVKPLLEAEFPAR